MNTAMTMDMKTTYFQGTEGSEGVKAQGTELAGVVDSTDAARTYREVSPVEGTFEQRD